LWWRNVPAALATTAVLLYAFAGTGRAQNLGVGEAEASRYAYLAVALVLPLVGQIVTVLRRSRVLRPVVVVGLVALIGVNASAFERKADHEARSTIATHRQVDAAAYLVRHGERFSAVALPAGSAFGPAQSTLTLGTLQGWVARDQYPVPTVVARGRLQAERAALSVFASPMRAHFAVVTFAEPHAPGCAYVRSGEKVLLNLEGPSSVAVAPSSEASFSTSSPLFVTVVLSPATGTALVLAGTFIEPADHWLNLPGNGYRTASVKAGGDAMTVCAPGR